MVYHSYRMEGDVWTVDPHKEPTFSTTQLEEKVREYDDRRIDIPWDEWTGIHMIDSEGGQVIRIDMIRRQTKQEVLAELRRTDKTALLLERVNWYDLILVRGERFLLEEYARLPRSRQAIQVHIVINLYRIVQFHGLREEHMATLLSSVVVTRLVTEFRETYASSNLGSIDVSTIAMYRVLLLIMYGNETCQVAHDRVRLDTTVAAKVKS